MKNNLYKRGNSWYICVKVGGKQIRKSFGANRREAELALAELKKQVAVGRATDDWGGLEKLVTPKSKLTFQEAAEAYLSERSLKQSSIISYREHLKNYLLPEFGSSQIVDITEEQISRFQARISKSLSARRTNSTVMLLRSVLKVCVRRKIIEENPATGVPTLREPQANIDPLTREELELALATIPALYRPIFTTLAWTGARPGELLALRWNDVNFIRKEIHICKARYKGVEDLPKTGSSERFILMLPPVIDVLTKLKSEQVCNLDGYVFVGKKGQPMAKHLDQVWAKALKRAGLRHRPSYQLRHTFASICFKQGAEPGWVQKALGHCTLQTTYRHYARFIQDASKANERLLNGMFETERVEKKAL